MIESTPNKVYHVDIPNTPEDVRPLRICGMHSMYRTLRNIWQRHMVAITYTRTHKELELTHKMTVLQAVVVIKIFL